MSLLFTLHGWIPFEQFCMSHKSKLNNCIFPLWNRSFTSYFSLLSPQNWSGLSLLKWTIFPFEGKKHYILKVQYFKEPCLASAKWDTFKSERQLWDQGYIQSILGDKTASLGHSQNLKSTALFISSFTWIISIWNGLIFIVCLPYLTDE